MDPEVAGCCDEKHAPFDEHVQDKKVKEHIRSLLPEPKRTTEAHLGSNIVNPLSAKPTPEVKYMENESRSKNLRCATIHLCDGEATLEREAATFEELVVMVADVVRWFVRPEGLNALGMADYNDEQLARALGENKIPSMWWEEWEEWSED